MIDHTYTEYDSLQKPINLDSIKSAIKQIESVPTQIKGLDNQLTDMGLRCNLDGTFMVVDKEKLPPPLRTWIDSLPAGSMSFRVELPWSLEDTLEDDAS